MRLIARTIAILLAMFLPTAAGANSIQDHSFGAFEHPKLQSTQSELTNLLMGGEFEALFKQGDDVEKWIQDSDVSATDHARYLSNLAVMLAQAGESNDALVASGKAQDLLETISAFHPDLYHVMMAKGYILVFENAHEEAEDALRHAQNIAHRNQGVYATEQLPTLRLLTEVLTSTGQGKDADQTQRFLLRVNEQAYGAASEEMIPSLTEVGDYFAKRGRTIPTGNTTRNTNVFMVGRNRSIDLDSSDADIAYRARIFREAESAFERSIEIIQDKYGPTDLRLVEPLKGLSQTKFLEGYARTYSEKPMEQMAAIVQQNPGADVGDKAKAWVDLADLYIKTEDPRAHETYKKAWDLLADEAHEELRYELFGKPVRLLPEFNFRPSLTRYPQGAEPGDQLFVDMSYTITETGRVRQVEITDSNIPLRDQKSTRLAVQLMKFRPRLIDGAPVRTEGLTLHQTFTVYKPEPEISTNVDVNF